MADLLYFQTAGRYLRSWEDSSCRTFGEYPSNRRWNFQSKCRGYVEYSETGYQVVCGASFTLPDDCETNAARS